MMGVTIVQVQRAAFRITGRNKKFMLYKPVYIEQGPVVFEISKNLDQRKTEHLLQTEINFVIKHGNEVEKKRCLRKNFSSWIESNELLTTL